MDNSSVLKEVNSIFEQPWWLDLVADSSWDEIVIYDKKHECIGRLPYVYQKKYFMNVCTVPVLTQQLGPWIHIDGNMKRVAKIKHTKKIIEQIIAELNKYKNVDLYLHKSYEYILPFIWAGYSVEPKISYVIENLEDLNFVESEIEAKVRNLIKGALKRVTVTDNVSVEDLINLLSYTFQKQRRELPFKKELISKVCEGAIKRDAGKLFGAVDVSSGKMVAAAFFVYDENTCYYLLGGKDYDAKINGCQELLLWQGIKFAAAVSREFDFEGSMIQGIESFFRGFGGKPCIYFRVYRGGLLFRFFNYVKPHIKRILKYK